MTETLIFAQSSGDVLAGLLAGMGAFAFVYLLLWAFVPIAVGRIWTHAHRAASVKTRWDLSIGQDEQTALAEMLAAC